MERASITIRIVGEIDLHVVTENADRVMPWVLGLAAQLSFLHAMTVPVYVGGQLFREVVTR